MKQPFRKSFETQKIEAMLRALAIGETLTYERMSKEIGAPVSGSFQPLGSARRILETEGGFVFAAIHKVGIKRLSDSDIVADTHSSRSIIARKAKRAMVRLSNIQNFASMNDDEKRQHQAHAVIYASIVEKTSSSNARQLSRTVNIDGQAMLSAIKEAGKT